MSRYNIAELLIIVVVKRGKCVFFYLQFNLLPFFIDHFIYKLSEL